MGRKVELMGHMEIHLMVVKSWIEMTQREMAGYWILWIGVVMEIGTTLVLVLIGIMIIIVNILKRYGILATGN